LQFLFCENGGETNFILSGEAFNYVFKVRRHKKLKNLKIRNPENPKTLFEYKITKIGRREAELQLISSEEKYSLPEKELIVGWAIVEPKIVEKTLPMLNEIGVKNLILITSDFSQRNFKFDLKRMEKILKNSSMQSGRFDFLKIEFSNSVQDFLMRFPNSAIIDFSQKKLNKNIANINSVLIGAEGGFSEKERKIFPQNQVYGLNSPYILKSETAVLVAISQII
jgi:16S rRNA (uracil1498-N3)-methyltransferase